MSDELEPQQEEDWVRIQFWKCNVIGHRHRNRRSAASCIMIRKGEAGELKKLERNLSMLEKLRKGETLINISKEHHCSDSNVIKAVNSTLTKAWRIANDGKSATYRQRNWKRQDFTDEKLWIELDYLVRILKELEVKLRKLV